MRRHKIAGNWATLLLPIAEDDTIDFCKLGEEIDILIGAKVDGIYSNGTAGEFHNQTEAEYEHIQDVLAARCSAAGMSFVIGACQPDPALTLTRVRRAAGLRPLAIQVILPDWWPLSNVEAIDYLQRISDEARGIPLILYNPPHAKRVLSPAELAAIFGPCPAVVGVKLADGDDHWYAEARSLLAEFPLFVPGHHLATGIKHGVASGAFSNVACLSPKGAQAWTNPDAHGHRRRIGNRGSYWRLHGPTHCAIQARPRLLQCCTRQTALQRRQLGSCRSTPPLAIPLNSR
jgi:dihydrodipicolinate synthase/N-acetylneuraminate lyase